MGDDHPAVSSSLNNLALLYESQGRYGEAEPLFRDALTLRQRRLGKAHPDVAISLWNLGALRYHQGRLEEAQSLLLKALPIYEATLGGEHPNTQNLKGWIEAVQNGLAASD